MHDVRALLANLETLRDSVRGLDGAVLCPLPQGFGLLPITDALRRELTSKPHINRELLAAPLAEIFPELHALALAVSDVSPVVFLSTEYFGGDGGQDAAAWQSRAVIFGPESPGYSREWPNSSISQALRAIGAVAEPSKDEFDTLGLGNHRETHRWAEAFSPAGREND